MITEQELNRVNEINKELHDITSLSNDGAIAKPSTSNDDKLLSVFPLLGREV